MRYFLFSKKIGIQFFLVLLSSFIAVLSFQNCGSSSFQTKKIELSSQQQQDALVNPKTCQQGSNFLTVGAQITGFAMSAATSPLLCGAKVTRTCLSTGQFDGSLPIYPACAQSCLHPDNGQPVSSASNFPYVYFTIDSADTQALCDQAKVTSYCLASTGLFTPSIAANRFLTCKVKDQVCAYTTAAGYATPTGFKVADTVKGFALQSALYPALCGAEVTRTCQVGGAWSGSIPLYTTCDQKCVHPATSMPAAAGSAFVYYTKAIADTLAECDAAKVTSTCQSASGLFAPAVPATFFQTCQVRTNVCSYPIVAGASLPTGSKVGDSVSGYTSESATYPTLCGSSIKSVCQNSGVWTGAVPLFPSCVQSCLDPDTKNPVSIGATFSYYSKASGTSAADCGSARVVVTCQASGLFSGSIPAYEQRFESCQAIGNPAPLKFKTIASASDVTCGITLSDNVMCWGNGQAGLFGVNLVPNSNIAGSSIPMPVGGVSGVQKIAVSSIQVCALTNSDQVYCWGYGRRLSATDVSDRQIPMLISGISNTKEIGVGNSLNCALSNAGTVKCWGENSVGQLGNNSTVTSYSPVDVAGLSGVVQIGTGDDWACARLTDGSVKCWGNNRDGNLGNGSVGGFSSVPVTVANVIGAKNLTAGERGSCVVTSADQLKCWGKYNYFSPTGLAVDIPGMTGIKYGISSATVVCALTLTGNVRCIGGNFSVQLGLDNVDQISTAQDLPNLSGVKGIALGWYSACLITNSDTVRCWGDASTSANTGHDRQTNSVIPIVVNYLKDTLQMVDSKMDQQGNECFVTLAGGIKCLGWNRAWNSTFILGNGSPYHAQFPVDVLGFSNVKQVAVTQNRSCGLMNDATMRCWFYTAVTPATLNGVSEITSGVDHICAIMNDKTLKCWGSNYYGVIGDGSTTSTEIPTTVPGLTNVKQVAANQLQSCALLTSGAVKCWGFNIGLSPVDIPEFNGAQFLAMGGQMNACVIKTDGQIACRGGNFHTFTTEQLFGSKTILQIGIGREFICGLNAGNHVKCYGSNFFGQLGNNSTVGRIVPMDFLAPAGVITKLMVTSKKTCVQYSTGVVACSGQLAPVVVTPGGELYPAY